MKKRAKKLSLSKETLLDLTAHRLRDAAAAEADIDGGGIGSLISCLSACICSNKHTCAQCEELL